VCVIGKAKAAELQLLFVNERLVCWNGWKEGWEEKRMYKLLSI